MTPSLDVYSPSYIPRDPSQTVLYTAVADHLETFLASLDADPDARGLPAYGHARCPIVCTSLRSSASACASVFTTVTSCVCISLAPLRLTPQLSHSSALQH